MNSRLSNTEHIGDLDDKNGNHPIRTADRKTKEKKIKATYEISGTLNVPNLVL